MESSLSHKMGHNEGGVLIGKNKKHMQNGIFVIVYLNVKFYMVSMSSYALLICCDVSYCDDVLVVQN